MSNHAKIILASIGLLFLVQEAIGLHLRWVDDESWYLLPAQSLLQEGRLRIAVFDDSAREFWAAPPLFSVLEAGSWMLRELTVIQARLLTVLFGTGAVLLTYLLGRRLFDERIGLAGALLCAVDNMVFLAGRTVRPEILVLFFTLLALWLLLKSIQDGTWWPVVAAGCAVGAGMSSHPNGAIAPLCGVALLLAYGGWKALRQPRLYVFALACTLAFLPMVIHFVANDGARGFQGLDRLQSLHAGRESSPMAWLLNSASREVRLRYWSFLAFPYRLHVGVLALAAVIVGLVRRNPATRFVAACVVLHMAFFMLVTKANHTPRYLALIMPFVTLLWAEWIVTLWSRWRTTPVRPRRPARAAALLGAALGLALLVGASQLAGNLAYLWKFRHADYPKVCRQIDTLIPPESTVYGGMAFWMDLHRDHTYVPYMRMPWEQAITEFRPNIVILDDWVMIQGSYDGEWDGLRGELYKYVDRHGRLLGTVENPFYGNLKIYEVTHPPVPAVARPGRDRDEAGHASRGEAV